ncbi:uncharacterized protein LOC105421996 [Pogonomyrmex barbatus]|uniref:Uncharacterized protein LOC105421996 n=1 Tax=Pogonomyrmex barbatus TaxID=144034 RepID=A0A6I9VUW4_9HYME|nr:uncharacterized protein LOC105421996 [Pogonomyrmex barbatus]
MEFYESRNAYKQCDEIEPNLDKVLPEKEEPDPERGPQENLPRLRGLGNKLDCFKAKYFDENPLDNPLFAEKLVEEPTPPMELNPTQFASKIMVLPEENDEYVVPRVSKKPERTNRQWRYRNHPYETHESIRVNYKHDPQTGRGRNAYFHTVRGSRPSNMIRRVKNRRLKPKVSSTTASSPKLYQTASYQNQVYEDVMGNIRNMKNAYQVHEMTTLPPSTQILATASSENMLKIANDTSSSSEEKSTSKSDVTEITNNTRSSEIKGLVPPPKYSIQTDYRKYRPPAKNRVSIIRSPNLPRIIAHHHTIKINKRSANDITKNSSDSIINEANGFTEATVNRSTETVRNDTNVKSVEEEIKKTNMTSEPLDLKIEESRQILTQDQGLSTTLKIEDKKRRRNPTNSNQRIEPQKVVYTIKDRIRYSKPKWDTRGFGKFSASLNTTDEDSRRKEPRYNHIKRKKKPVIDDQQNNSTIMNSTENTSGIESTTLLIEDRESSTTEVYHAEESIQQMIYHKKDEHPELEKTEVIDKESKESFFEEEEEEDESMTNTYQVRENINEHDSTTARSKNPQSSKEVLDLQKYLESEPPGYEETFSEEATTPSSKSTHTDHESEDSEEKQDEETENVESSWDNDSSEKTEEQVETPIKAELSTKNDNSKEEEESHKDHTFFKYPRPSLIGSDSNNEQFEKTTFRPFPFSRYKSKFKKESEDEESEEKNEDYVFPWHADKENTKDKHKWLHEFDRYEYPWERRERLARERRRKRKPIRFFDDKDEEESTRRERLIYPWEKYDVPSKPYTRINTRRDVSRRHVDDSENSSSEYVPFTKFSSRYSSTTRPTYNAREISRSIKKLLEEDNESKEQVLKDRSELEDHSSSFAQKTSLSSNRGLSSGMLIPEDITQPPRRKNTREKTPQIDKNVSNNSHFDSKKLKQVDLFNEHEEEEPVEYLKLNKSNLDESALPIEVTSSQPSQLLNKTKEIPPATEQRKKRRRKISKNNSTISSANAPAESVTKPTKKKRRRPVTLSTMTTTPTTSFDFGTRKSISIPNRNKSKKDEKINSSASFETIPTAKIIVTPETIKADNFQIETSTPKTRTIEHRSRVSKEKISTKTTYPNDIENIDFMKTNLTSAQEEPTKLKIKSRRKKNNIRQDDNKKESIKQENTKEEAKSINEDEIKKSVILNKPEENNENKAFSRLSMGKEEIKEINNFGAYDGIVNDDNHNASFGSSEIYAVRNLMQNIPPNQGKNRSYEWTEKESNREIENWKEQNNSKKANEKDEEEDVTKKPRLLLQAKFIKDPERRLYYYVERK